MNLAASGDWRSYSIGVLLVLFETEWGLSHPAPASLRPFPRRSTANAIKPSKLERQAFCSCFLTGRLRQDYISLTLSPVRRLKINNRAVAPYRPDSQSGGQTIG